MIRFGSDVEPGIRRSGTKRFVYVDETSGRAANAIDVARIRGLAVPPAWTRVWIAADAESHLQATGRDARGRKQYRYHPAFTASRADHKFADLVQFGHRLGRLRRRVAHDLARPTLDHDLVVVTVVRLIDVTSLRIGNDQYARANKSFGVTTLHNRHVAVRGSTIRIAFRGADRRFASRSAENRRSGLMSAFTTPGWPTSSGVVSTYQASTCSSIGRRTAACGGSRRATSTHIWLSMLHPV